MEQRGYRRGCHRGVGQPAVEGKHRRLDAEAQKGQHKHVQQHPLVACRQFRVQHTAIGEVQRGAVVHQKHDADEGKGGTGQGVDQILLTGVAGLAVHPMHHQGQRSQSQQLIEEIQAQKVLGEGHAQHHAIAHGQEAEKPILASLVLHVLEGVKYRHRPEHGDDSAKDHGGSIDGQGDGEVPSKLD